MSIRITKGSYTSTIDSTSLSANRTITIPNASGTLALTGQFATVATSGSYNDLSNRPALKTVATSGAYNDLSGKPTLAKVATSGSYNDLSNKPSIPATPQGYITQTWRSGNNWYRVYSDGWIEQGNEIKNVNNQSVAIKFSKSYTSTNYFLTFTLLNVNSYGNYGKSYGNMTTSGCTLYGADITLNRTLRYYVCRY